MLSRIVVIAALFTGCGGEIGQQMSADSAWDSAGSDGFVRPGGGGDDSDDSGDSAVDAADDTSAPDAAALRFDGPRPRNVLMISVDTFRPDFMGRASGVSDDSPVLDALLADGVVLDNHRGCSNWTLAAVSCVQSGMRSTESGHIVRPGVIEPIPDNIQLSSEVLHAAGFQTALVSGNSVFGPNSELDRGFDISVNAMLDADQITHETRQVFDTLDADQPWYVHAHFFDPHTPYSPPEQFLGDTSHLPAIPYDLSDREAYADIHSDWSALNTSQKDAIAQNFQHFAKAEVRHMDFQIGLLLEDLEAAGWLDDTLIVFWSDHGEQFGEHGDLGHAISLYLSEVDTIAAFHAPGLQPAVWSGPTNHVDLWPTILDALELDLDAPFLGDVVGTRPDDDHRFSSHTAGVASVQTIERSGTRLHYKWSGEVELFDIDEDPEEQRDLFKPDDAEAIALWEILKDEIDLLQEQMEDGDPTAPDSW